MSKRRHPSTPSTPFAIAPLALALLALALAAPTRAAESPWVLLQELRDQLAAGDPLTARFVQTYVPAGFAEGDSESGHLSLWLPRCLRWNYDEGRSYLLCDGEVHQWNEDELAGRIFAVDPAQETGLDLLLVDVDTLRERYVAGSEDLDGGGKVIELALPAEEGSFRARIHLDAAGRRVTRLEYTDSEGNRTRFDIDGYQTLAHTALFTPPTDIEWTRE